MEIGKNIKDLRRERDMTQEQLAQALSISPQAVSRWECGDGMPDISMIPMLCHLFDVSSDRLLGIDVEKKADRIKEISHRGHAYKARGYFREAREILEEGLREYPNSEQLLCDLMYVAYCQCLEAGTEPEKNNYQEESIRLGEKILENSKTDNIRHGAIQILCLSYAQMGQIERARALAKQMPYICMSYESLSAVIERGDRQYRAIQCEISVLFDGLLNNIVRNVKLDDGNMAYTPEEMVTLRDRVMRMIELFHEDEELGFDCCRMESLGIDQARYYAKRQDRENTFRYLQLAATYANRFVEYAKKKDFIHTGLVLRGFGSGSFSTGNPNNDAAEMLEVLNEKVFDFIREDEAFQRLVDTLMPYAGKWEI